MGRHSIYEIHACDVCEQETLVKHWRKVRAGHTYHYYRCDECKGSRKSYQSRTESNPHAQHDRNRSIIEDFLGGMTKADIGKKHGVSRERIRQIVVRGIGRDGNLVAQVEARERKLAAQSHREPIDICVVCWGPVYKRSGYQNKNNWHIIYRTCSAVCHQVRDVARHKFPGHKREIYLRWCQRNPEKVRPAQVAFATRQLSGKGTARNLPWRPWEKHKADPNSKASKAWEWAQSQRALHIAEAQSENEVIAR